jgi:radical SAM superfamily enzyme YgiQ (UPF0313 family)
MNSLKKTKILLIQPSPYTPRGNVIKKRRLYFVGLALPLLAALTPSDYEVELCYETIESVPFDTDADIIGISSMGHGVHRTIDLAKHFKKMGKIVVLGGYMVSLMPKEAIKFSDAVFIGDSEETWPQFLQDYKLGSVQPFYVKKINHYDPPLPKYELLLNKPIGNFLPVQAGRGCVNTCSFCSIACLYKGEYHKRPVVSVIRDIKKIKSLGFNQFLLLDDNLFSDRDYTLSLCKEIKSLKMSWFTQCTVTVGDDPELLKILRSSGCRALSFGLESISQLSLDLMDKPWAMVSDYKRQLEAIRKADIDLSSEMVVGADGDTLESIKQTATFVADNYIQVPRFYILTPIPGTLFHKDMLDSNRLVNLDYYAYTGDAAVHKPTHMSAQELTDAYWKLYKQVYTLPNILKRVFGHSAFLKRPIRSLFYLYINLYYRHQIHQGITPNII